MRFKILGMLCEAGAINSKLPANTEAAYAQFETDFRREKGKDVSKATTAEIKNSKAWKKMIAYLHQDDDLGKVGNNYDDYNYYDHYDSYAKYDF